MRKTRRKARRVSNMNTFHDLYVLFLANRDRELEFVKNFPPTYTSVFSHGSDDTVITESSDYSVKVHGEKERGISPGEVFHKLRTVALRTWTIECITLLLRFTNQCVWNPCGWVWKLFHEGVVRYG